MFYYIISKMSDMRPFINPILFMKISPISGFTVFYRGYPIQNIQKIGYRYFLFKLKKKGDPDIRFYRVLQGVPTRTKNIQKIGYRYVLLYNFENVRYEAENVQYEAFYFPYTKNENMPDIRFYRVLQGVTDSKYSKNRLPICFII